ncbi:DNA mismatch repair endonuclease MutL [Clostridium cylindrosporum]|uniref:DNA mismatch repair protein MutL n=1 Tax=Clostridium cylindrosporum DSM 605 TaxID=1121307 RepID=A0A0J8DAH8_CLOCY|nr:DNA mismatch repair endonuclease MutL [Clostridium cylindrosporum]KMT23030.1 DNA mismatch repair protein MutL [Clostridium cylindrosporum DSM 605]
MKIINLLDEKTINKIAAGEVVERPLSIVKELVENSIDSGASEITIEVKKDPLRYIRISDNGSGILADDVESAFMRHATSKIKSINDIECIRSLGFRGEALSSISAISKVEMLTRVESEEIGQKVLVKGGKLIYKEDAGCPKGTIITIKDVFFNTPARLKFLKSTSRELSSITELVEKIALSNVNVSFRYKIDEKLIFLTPGKGDLKGIIRTIFGKNAYNNIIPIEEEDEDFKLTGYIGNTSLVKGNRSLEIVFVNGRIIKSPLISSAVEKAYKSMLPINKFPFFVINIEINPRFTDVNVHPTKAEIKFQDDHLIYSKIYRIIKRYIEEDFDIKNAFDEEIFKENVSYVQGEVNYNAVENIAKTVKEEAEDITYSNPSLEEKVDKNDIKNKCSEGENTPLYKNEEVKEQDSVVLENPKQIKEIVNKPQTEIKLDNIRNNTISFENKEEVKEKEDKIPTLRILGQINSTFIIAEALSEMYIIDQHAAHERIYYEKYMKEFNDFSIKSQPLLAPIVQELTISEKQMLLSNLDNFKKIGFIIEDFGSTSIAIREVPILYGNPDPLDMFNEILEDVLGSKEKKVTSCIDKIIYSMACKSSVKAGDTLTSQEIEKLIDSLRECKSPFTCPHGRPTIIKMSHQELEKKFKRIQ